MVSVMITAKGNWFADEKHYVKQSPQRWQVYECQQQRTENIGKNADAAASASNNRR